MTPRSERQLRILQLVEARPLRTQEEVAGALRAAGFSVTQSSVSRDLAVLGLAKVGGVYARPAAPAAAQDDVNERHIRESLLAVSTAGDALVVLRTPPGEATRVALALDRLAWRRWWGRSRATTRSSPRRATRTPATGPRRACGAW